MVVNLWKQYFFIFCKIKLIVLSTKINRKLTFTLVNIFLSYIYQSIVINKLSLSFTHRLIKIHEDNKKLLLKFIYVNQLPHKWQFINTYVNTEVNVHKFYSKFPLFLNTNFLLTNSF